MPKVSIIIPAYNAERFIAQSVRSATEQSYADIEVIVVDDGSRDATTNIASAYPGVQVLRQANAGVSAARNAGVRASSGELVAFLDADDVWHADKIATQVALLDRYRDSDLTYTRVDHHALDPSLDIRAEQHSLIADLETTFLNPYLCTSAVMVRRSAFDRVGGFDSSLRYAEDVDLFLRIVVAKPLVPVLEQPAVYKRAVVDSLGDDSTAGYEKLLKVYGNLLTERPDIVHGHRRMVALAFADLHLRHSRCLLRDGNQVAALRAALRSLGAQPSAAATLALTRACTPPPLLRAGRRLKRMIAQENVTS